MRFQQIINISQSDVTQWHGLLLQKARDVGEYCATLCSVPDTHRVVKFLVGHPEFCHLFGAPLAGVRLPEGDEPYERWLNHLWGRRCSYYFSSLCAGLRASLELNPESESLAALIKSLEPLDGKLARIFKRQWEGGQLEASLAQRGDIANFHVTYLDPVLFSCLYCLNLQKHGELRSKQAVPEMLWELIGDEVGKSTLNGTEMSSQIVDESTVWWGFAEFARRDPDHFKLGEFKGVDGIADVCINLISGSDRQIRCPEEKHTLYEATYEIYGETRTRILVAKNCVELAKLLHRKSSPVPNQLSSFIDDQLTLVMDEKAGVLKHVCFIGLGLELSSSALRWFSQHPPPASRHGTPAGKAGFAGERPNQGAETAETNHKLEEWIEIFRGVGEHPSHLDSNRLFLPKALQLILKDRLDKEWCVFLLGTSRLILFPKRIWDEFWKRAEKNFKIDQKLVRELREMDCRQLLETKDVTKLGAGNYTEKYWILPRKVLEKVDLSGEGNAVARSKISVKCEIRPGRYWLEIVPRRDTPPTASVR